MVNQRKSDQAKRQPRNQQGEFSSTGGASVPASDMLAKYAPQSSTPTPPPVDLAFDLDPYEAQEVEFDIPGGRTVHGYALDTGERIDPDGLPGGWHKYSVMEDDDSGAIDVAPYHLVNHRMDFVTDADLGDGFQADGDSWGFTGRNLIDDMPDGFDVDVYREERRKRLMDMAIDDSTRVPCTEDRLTALRMAVGDLMRQNPNDDELSVYDIRPTDEAKRYGKKEAEDDWFASSLMLRDDKITTRSPFVHINKDGDWEGLSQRRAEQLLWRNRQTILRTVRDGNMVEPRLASMLASVFRRH